MYGIFLLLIKWFLDTLYIANRPRGGFPGLDKY